MPLLLVMRNLLANMVSKSHAMQKIQRIPRLAGIGDGLLPWAA
jgi:hypothetical protein